jgi:predicted amidohydrolase
VNLALVQLRVDPGQKKENVARAVSLMMDAVRQSAQVILLPEAFSLGWTDPAAAIEAEPIPDGPTCTRLRELAAQHGVYLCAGLVERAGKRVFNSAVLIGPDGTLFVHHRKIHELGIAHDCYAQGDRLQVAETPLGRIGVMICADAFAPGQVISRTLGLMGADLILSPCAWAVPPDHDQARDPYGKLWLDHYGPVAREFRLWIAGCSNVGPMTGGPWAGRRCIGSSLVVGPDGTKFFQGPYGEEAEAVLHVVIDIESQRAGPRPRTGHCER